MVFDPPPRGLFVPSLHHSALSSLTPALLSGRSIGPRSVHKAEQGSADLLLISLSYFLLSAPTGKTPVSCMFHCISKVLILLIAAEKLSSGSDSWGLFHFRCVCLRRGAIEREEDKEIHKHRPQKQPPRWPPSSSGELELRSLLHFDGACFATCPLLDSDYLYYPISALHSGLCPALEDTGQNLLWLLLPAS